MLPEPALEINHHKRLAIESLLEDGLALVYPLIFQGAKICITHKPSSLFEPLDLLAQPLRHHHVLSLSIQAPSCTNIFEFH